MVAMADGNFNCQLHCHRTISYPDDDNWKVWRYDHTLGPRVTITFMVVALHRARKLQVSAVNRGLCSWKRSVSLGWLEAIDSSEHVRGCRGSLLYNICFWRHWWYTHARTKIGERITENTRWRTSSTYLLPELGEQVYTLLLEQPVHGLHGLNVQRVGLRRGLHAGQCRRVQAG